jgi:hypothetical protein
MIVNDEVLAAAVHAGAGSGYMMEHDVVDEIANERVAPALRPLVDALRWRDA